MTDETILSEFKGDGTVSLGLDATSVLEALFTGGDVTSEISADATARSTLVYNYDVADVSAPSTFIMMGCVLGVVGFSNRKRAEKA